MPLELRAAAGRHHDRPSGDEADLLTILQYAVRLADAIGFGVVETMKARDSTDLAGDAPEPLRGSLQRDAGELGALLDARIEALDGPMPDAKQKPARLAEPLPAEQEGEEVDDWTHRALPWAVGAVSALAAAVGAMVFWG